MCHRLKLVGFDDLLLVNFWNIKKMSPSDLNHFITVNLNSRGINWATWIYSHGLYDCNTLKRNELHWWVTGSDRSAFNLLSKAHLIFLNLNNQNVDMSKNVTRHLHLNLHFNPVWSSFFLWAFSFFVMFYLYYNKNPINIITKKITNKKKKSTRFGPQCCLIGFLFRILRKESPVLVFYHLQERPVYTFGV